MLRKISWALGGCCAVACSGSNPHPAPAAGTLAAVTRAAKPTPHKFTTRQMDGSAFPDGVVSLTWDDGPDAHTLELAEFLHERKVSGTFFVVQEWQRGVSDDPGTGKGVYSTGYAHVPILEQLVRLGHRLGNHTANHRLLSRVASTLVVDQLELNQRSLEPWIHDDVKLFRAPGGDWGDAAARAANSRPELANLLGPVRWDIDGKDWQASIECTSEQPQTECESVAGHRRTKPAVVARRYLEAIEHRRHGIVLLHDRVGDVGSRYSLEVAQILVSELQARKFVFVAPVLGFSPLRVRPFDTINPMKPPFPDPGPERDHCLVAASLPATSFGAVHVKSQLADVNGDRRPDCCAVTPEGVLCAIGAGEALGTPEFWSVGSNFGRYDAHSWFTNPSYYESIHFADINGDGRDDICGRAADGVSCALSAGSAFASSSNWLKTGMTDSDGWLTRDPSTLTLADANGDGRADVCVNQMNFFECALAP